MSLLSPANRLLMAIGDRIASKVFPVLKRGMNYGAELAGLAAYVMSPESAFQSIPVRTKRRHGLT